MIALDEAGVIDFVMASAKVLDLPLPPLVLPGVIANMSVLLQHAARVMAFDVARDQESKQQ